jgi:RNA recognition motif-containing protein
MVNLNLGESGIDAAGTQVQNLLRIDEVFLNFKGLRLTSKKDTTVYVNNLHHKMKEKHLKEPFEKVGEIDRLEIVRDPFSG